MGAADQAKKDLTPPDEQGPPDAAGGTTNTQPARPCVLVVDGALSDHSGCSTEDAVLNASVAAGRWQWVDSSTGIVSAGPTTGLSGAWVWVGSSGEVMQRPVDGGWFWVTTAGAVGTTASGNGGWYWLTSPNQVSSTPTAGSIRLTDPGTDPTTSGRAWYFATSVPVFGESGSEPHMPLVSGGGATPTQPGTTSAPSDTAAPEVNPCTEQLPIDDSTTVLNGWADNGMCKTRFMWTTTGRVTTPAGTRYVISGSVTRNDRAATDPVAVDIYLSRDGHGNTTVTSVRTSVPLISGAGSAQIVPDARCGGSGVQAVLADPAGPAGPVTWQLLPCDDQLVRLVDAP